jgi:hypothetical protein
MLFLDAGTQDLIDPYVPMVTDGGAGSVAGSAELRRSISWIVHPSHQPIRAASC